MVGKLPHPLQTFSGICRPVWLCIKLGYELAFVEVIHPIEEGMFSLRKVCSFNESIINLHGLQSDCLPALPIRTLTFHIYHLSRVARTNVCHEPDLIIPYAPLLVRRLLRAWLGCVVGGNLDVYAMIAGWVRSR